jgi:hypothetical protein
LLAEPEIHRAASAVILAAESSLSAICGTERLRRLGYQVAAVSGRFTSSPLAMREYHESGSPIPVVCSAESGEQLALRLRTCLKLA